MNDRCGRIKGAEILVAAGESGILVLNLEVVSKILAAMPRVRRIVVEKEEPTDCRAIPFTANHQTVNNS